MSTDSGVKAVDAEFHELGKDRPKKEKKDEKQRFFSELLEIGRRRGFSDGWVSHTYRKKFGVWPKGLQRVVDHHPRGKTWDFVAECRKEYLAQKHNSGPKPETPVELEEMTS